MPRTYVTIEPCPSDLVGGRFLLGNDAVLWENLSLNSFQVFNGVVTDMSFIAQAINGLETVALWLVIDCSVLGASNHLILNFDSSATFDFVGNNEGFAGVTFTPAGIPLPAGAVLMLSALGGLGLAARRRRARAG